MDHVAGTDADAQAAQARGVHRRVGGQEAERRLDVLDLARRVLELAPVAAAAAPAAEVEGQRRQAAFGQGAGVAGRHLLLHGHPGAGDHHRRHGAIRTGAVREVQVAGQALPAGGELHLLDADLGRGGQGEGKGQDAAKRAFIGMFLLLSWGAGRRWKRGPGLPGGDGGAGSAARIRRGGAGNRRGAESSAGRVAVALTGVAFSRGVPAGLSRAG